MQRLSLIVLNDTDRGQILENKRNGDTSAQQGADKDKHNHYDASASVQQNRAEQQHFRGFAEEVLHLGMPKSRELLVDLESSEDLLVGLQRVHAFDDLLVLEELDSIFESGCRAIPS